MAARRAGRPQRQKINSALSATLARQEAMKDELIRR
jgi:hypothetical protein